VLPTTPAATAAPSSVLRSSYLTISVQSDSQMQAAGNTGPSSSILLPASCELKGTAVTAEGTYQGGFAPNVYSRYGDVVKLYVYTASVSGHPQGIQVAQLTSEDSPAIGGYGTWRVTARIDSSLGQPESCLIAAQPTHDVQLAP
jgi:hypothetical protein